MSVMFFFVWNITIVVILSEMIWTSSPSLPLLLAMKILLKRKLFSSQFLVILVTHTYIHTLGTWIESGYIHFIFCTIFWELWKLFEFEFIIKHTVKQRRKKSSFLSLEWKKTATFLSWYNRFWRMIWFNIRAMNWFCK